MQRTGGDWRAAKLFPADDGDPRWGVGPDPSNMSVIAVTASENDEGNARLMAAAPRMERAVRKLLALNGHFESCPCCARDFAGGGRHCPEYGRLRAEAVREAAEALAAAEGVSVEESEWSLAN